ncbi:MAG: type II secretion system F family protein [Deltaproteobacteria bacterium]|nr:type II secretion system F family protein [Deltaproteobacteria bacterium]
MSVVNLAILIAVIIAVAGLSAIAFVIFGGRAGKSRTEVRELMSSAGRRDKHGNKIQIDIEDIKKITGAATAKKKEGDLNTKLFRAGFYGDRVRQRFIQSQVVLPVIMSIVMAYGAWAWLKIPVLVVLGIIMGAFVGYALPMSWLERKIRAREEDTMYYLPLVIEQVAIGVSSALDVGPCIAQIVEMAYERNSHNPVTEMFIHVEKLIRSGLGLSEALEEVGSAHGMNEVKHAFMFLAQCARHGGELSKQLQELADAVMTQRQIQVEGRISALPVKATGPLAVVFTGFFSLLFAGIAVKIMSAFS